MRNLKSASNQFLKKLAILKSAHAQPYFLDNRLKNQERTINLFRNRINCERFIFDFKGSYWFFGPVVWHWRKRNVPSFKKVILTRTLKSLKNLPAGAGRYTPITCRNRRQSLDAEIFACICRQLYLKNSLPAATACNFALASFRVWSALFQLINSEFVRIRPFQKW